MKNNNLENYVEIPLAKLVKAEWNYKTENAEKSEKLRANLTANGQVQNLIVREIDDDGTGQIYEVVNGNHRLDDMEILGWKSAVCYNLGPISLSQAKRIAIETNETNFVADDEKLAELLWELVGEIGVDDLLETMPFTLDDFAEIISNHDDEVKQDIKVKAHLRTSEGEEKISAMISVMCKPSEIEFIVGQLEAFFMGRFDVKIVTQDLEG